MLACTPCAGASAPPIAWCQTPWRCVRRSPSARALQQAPRVRLLDGPRAAALSRCARPSTLKYALSTSALSAMAGPAQEADAAVWAAQCAPRQARRGRGRRDRGSLRAAATEGPPAHKLPGHGPHELRAVRRRGVRRRARAPRSSASESSPPPSRQGAASPEPWSSTPQSGACAATASCATSPRPTPSRSAPRACKASPPRSRAAKGRRASRARCPRSAATASTSPATAVPVPRVQGERP